MSSISNISEVPSLDEQMGNMPGLSAYDPGFEEWLDEHEQPITAEEDEAMYQDWLKQEEMRAAVIAASQPKPRERYHMVALRGKERGYFEIRRDSDGAWVQVIRGRAEAKRELDKMNAA